MHILHTAFSYWKPHFPHYFTFYIHWHSFFCIWKSRSKRMSYNSNAILSRIIRHFIIFFVVYVGYSSIVFALRIVFLINLNQRPLQPNSIRIISHTLWTRFSNEEKRILMDVKRKIMGKYGFQLENNVFVLSDFGPQDFV